MSSISPKRLAEAGIVYATLTVEGGPVLRLLWHAGRMLNFDSWKDREDHARTLVPPVWNRSSKRHLLGEAMGVGAWAETRCGREGKLHHIGKTFMVQTTDTGFMFAIARPGETTTCTQCRSAK